MEESERRDERIATQVALSLTCNTATHRERTSNLVHKINCPYRRTAIDTTLRPVAAKCLTNSIRAFRRNGLYTNRNMCVTKYVRY
jgi:hypothetical protein